MIEVLFEPEAPAFSKDPWCGAAIVVIYHYYTAASNSVTEWIVPGTGFF